MEKRFFTWALAAALCVGGALTSCSDDDTTPDGGNGNGGTTTRVQANTSLQPRPTKALISSPANRSTKVP